MKIVKHLICREKMWDLGQSHSHCTIVSFVAQQ